MNFDATNLQTDETANDLGLEELFGLSGEFALRSHNVPATLFLVAEDGAAGIGETLESAQKALKSAAPLGIAPEITTLTWLAMNSDVSPGHAGPFLEN